MKNAADPVPQPTQIYKLLSCGAGDKSKVVKQMWKPFLGNGLVP